MDINNLSLPKNIGRTNEITIESETTEISTAARHPYHRKAPHHHRRPPPRRSSWGIDKLGIRTLWKEGWTGKDVKICVLDTGINTSHRDIKLTDYANFTNSHTINDLDGHGTHTAGTCAGRNKLADVGVAPDSSLYVAKVFNDRGDTNVMTLMNAINWATALKVDVISMSLGGDGDIPMYLAKAIGLAIENGHIVVVAAGNSGPYRNTIEEPGNFTPCVTVGAVMPNFKIAGFSSRGSQIDIVAPGVNILSCYKGASGSYANLSGTSMATPFVAGVACLFVQKARSVGMKFNQQIFERLVKETATDLGPKGFDMDYGAGLINPIKLLAVVETIAKPSPTNPPKDETKN